VLKEILVRLVSDRLRGHGHGGTYGKKPWKKKHKARYGGWYGDPRGPYGGPHGGGYGPSGYGQPGHYGSGYSGGYDRPRGLKGMIMNALLRYLSRR
jgi:hypothetical protein